MIRILSTLAIVLWSVNAHADDCPFGQIVEGKITIPDVVRTALNGLHPKPCAYICSAHADKSDFYYVWCLDGQAAKIKSDGTILDKGPYSQIDKLKTQDEKAAMGAAAPAAAPVAQPTVAAVTPTAVPPAPKAAAPVAPKKKAKHKAPHK